MERYEYKGAAHAADLPWTVVFVIKLQYFYTTTAATAATATTTATTAATAATTTTATTPATTTA